jgi:hypothetical protein
MAAAGDGFIPSPPYRIAEESLQSLQNKMWCRQRGLFFLFPPPDLPKEWWKCVIQKKWGLMAGSHLQIVIKSTVHLIRIQCTWHNTRVFDFTYFSRSQRSKFKMTPYSWYISLLFDLEHSNLVWTCTCILAPSMFLPNFGPIRLQIWLPGGHLGKPTKSYYSWTNGWISSKF